MGGIEAVMLRISAKLIRLSFKCAASSFLRRDHTDPEHRLTPILGDYSSFFFLLDTEGL
jgi:hypothetical protein